MFSNKSIIGIFTMLILITASVIFIGAGHEKSTEQAAGKMTAEQMMTFMDSNGDGRITRDEAPAELKAGFDFFDQDKDGGIDINEAQILADYDDNQATEQTAVQSSTANEEKLQSPTTNGHVKYESAAVVDQVGTETIEVWVGNMYFSMEMSGSHQQMITDLKNINR